MTFANQVAVITGASSGIGWELAHQLAAEGCKVGLIARRGDVLEKLANEIRQRGGAASAEVADVGDRGQIQLAIANLASRLGPIDLLIANAGVGGPTRIRPFNAVDTERVFRVNFLGVIWSFEAVLPAMLQRGAGRLAAVSSLGAYRGMPGESAYCASKAAVNAYLDGLRVQLRDSGVHVTTLCPGFVRTPMTAKNHFAMPWLLEPDEAARLMISAIRRGAKVYNFPWQTTLLMKLARWLPDWLLARLLRRAGQMPIAP